MIKPKTGWLEGKPDQFLTLALIGAGTALILLGLFGKNPVFKGVVLAWVLLP